MLDDVRWTDLTPVSVVDRCLAVTAMMQTAREIDAFRDATTRALARAINPREYARSLVQLGTLTKLAMRTWAELVVATDDAAQALAATATSIATESRFRRDTLDRLLDLPERARRLNLDFALAAARLPAKVRPDARVICGHLRDAADSLEYEVGELHAVITARLMPDSE